MTGSCDNGTFGRRDGYAKALCSIFTMMDVNVLEKARFCLSPHGRSKNDIIETERKISGLPNRFRSSFPTQREQMYKKMMQISAVFTVSMGIFCSASGQEKDEPKIQKLPNVLILGDSISIGYTAYVQKTLADKAHVFRPTNTKGRPENCAGTINGVKNIDRWLKAGDRKWSVIHFNFGLHDLKRVHPETRKNSNDIKHPRQSEPEAYRKQLTEIVEKLQATGAKLIFATTTPVPPGGVKPHRDVEDPQRYNEIAKSIMKPRGIEVNDIFAAAQAKLDKIIRPVNVHFTKAGSEYLGSKVVEAIEKALPSKR